MYRFDPGQESVTVHIHVRDDFTGKGKVGLTATTPGAVLAYTRKGGVAVSIPLVALATPTSAWVAGGFIEIDGTLAKGEYRLDLPNGAPAVGVPFFTVHHTFNGALDEACLVRLETPSTQAGTGVQAETVTVTNSLTSLPVAGALVWVSTDTTGSNVVAGALPTDAFGQVVFYLDPGTYYVWVRDSGFTGTNPTTLVVT